MRADRNAPADSRNLRISSRRYVPTDLERVSADLARVVVILAPAGDPEAADRATLRAVLALRSFEAGPELGGR